MSKWIFCLMLSAVMSSTVFGQDKKPVFVGLQPGVTVEPFYEKGDFDVNVVPVVVQLPLAKRLDFRFTSLANYHFGSSSEFSDIGVQLIFPVYFRKKESTNELSHGLYLGPLIGGGRNLMNEHYTYIAGIETGYMFPTDNRFSLTLGLQLGGSYFSYDNEADLWRNHFGFKINLGFWLNKD